MRHYGRVLVLLALTASLAAFSFTSADSAGHVNATGKLSVPRFSQTATLLPNGKVLIAGGMERNGKYDASAELYDPHTGVFTPTATMESARSCHTATLLPNGKVLIAGGSDGTGTNLASAELYDPATERFAPTGNLTGPRCGAAAVLLKSGKVLLVGGDGAHEYDRLTSAELYDPATGRFTATGSMRVPRAVTHRRAARRWPGAGARRNQRRPLIPMKRLRPAQRYMIRRVADSL